MRKNDIHTYLKIHLGFYQSGRYPNFSGNEKIGKISRNENRTVEKSEVFNTIV